MAADPSSSGPVGPRSRVEVVGLQDRPELNHAIGTVEDYDAGLSRWRVRLDKGGMKLFREGNLKRLVREETRDEARAGVAPFQQRPSQERPGRGAMPAELLDELLSPAPADKRPGAPGVSEDKGVASSPSWQAAVERRLAGLEKQLEEMSATMGDQQLLVDDLWNRGGGLDGGGGLGGDAFKTQVAELEAFRAASEAALRKLQANSTAAVSRLSNVEARLRCRDNSVDELRLHLDLLQDCLERQKVLPSWSILAGVHRQRFKAACKASGWRAAAGIVDVFKQKHAMILLLGFAGPEESLAVQSAATSASPVNALGHTLKMQGRLQSAWAAAENDPGSFANWSALKSTIQAARDADVDGQQIRAAERFCAQGRAKVAVEKSGSLEELAAAIRAAKHAGIAEAEVRVMEARASSRIGESQRVGDAQRKLRIAVSWASSQNVAKLQKAIAEAEEAGVDAEEIAKAERELSGLLPSVKQDPKPEPAQPAQPTAGLSDLLRAAKPLWSPKDLENAIIKLGSVGIGSIPELGSALASDAPENSLNEMLKKAGQKTFTEDTVKSFRMALRGFRNM